MANFFYFLAASCWYLYIIPFDKSKLRNFHSLFRKGLLADAIGGRAVQTRRFLGLMLVLVLGLGGPAYGVTVCFDYVLSLPIIDRMLFLKLQGD